MGCPGLFTPVHGGWFDDPPRWGRYLAPLAGDWFGTPKPPRAFKLPMVELIAAGLNTSTPLPIGLPLFALRTGGDGFGPQGWALALVEELAKGGVVPLDGFGGLWPLDFVELDRWREALEPEVVLCANGAGYPLSVHFARPPNLDGRDTCGLWKRVAEVHPTLPRDVARWDEVEALT